MQRPTRNRPGRAAGRGASVLVLAALTAADGGAAEPHLHGRGELSVAIEQGRVDIFLTAPLGDLAAGDTADTETVPARLGHGDVLVFPGANCTFDHSESAVTALAEDPAEAHSEDAAEADAHRHEHRHDEGHDPADEGDDHEGHEGQEGHSDVSMSWRYQCENDPATLQVGLFALTRLERIEVQAIGAGGVRVATVTAESPRIELP